MPKSLNSPLSTLTCFHIGYHNLEIVLSSIELLNRSECPKIKRWAVRFPPLLLSHEVHSRQCCLQHEAMFSSRHFICQRWQATDVREVTQTSLHPLDIYVYPQNKNIMAKWRPMRLRKCCKSIYAVFSIESKFSWPRRPFGSCNRPSGCS
jgi:hypothetical protein